MTDSPKFQARRLVKSYGLRVNPDVIEEGKAVPYKHLV